MAMHTAGAALGGALGSQQSAALPQPTLTSQASALIDRLDRAFETSRAITDRLLGSRPRDASANEKMNSPVVPSVERLLELAHTRMSEIEEELSRANCGI